MPTDIAIRPRPRGTLRRLLWSRVQLAAAIRWEKGRRSYCRALVTVCDVLISHIERVARSTVKGDLHNEETR